MRATSRPLTNLIAAISTSLAPRCRPVVSVSKQTTCWSAVVAGEAVDERRARTGLGRGELAGKGRDLEAGDIDQLLAGDGLGRATGLWYQTGHPLVIADVRIGTMVGAAGDGYASSFLRSNPSGKLEP